MDQKTDVVTRGLSRLNRILPLKTRQQALPQELRQLHRQVLRSLAGTGNPPAASDISKDYPAGALNALAEQDLLVLNSQGEIRGCYPFTCEQREHLALMGDRRMHAMCALDLLSIAPMFQTRLRLESRCRLTGEPLWVEQEADRILSRSEPEPWVAIDWAAESAGCCADSLCTEMMFIVGEQAARNWRQENPQQRDVYDLAQAIAFGDRFFSPLLSDRFYD